MTSIAIVTPWRDHAELAEDYFAAVLPELDSDDEVLIVDNGSKPSLANALPDFGDERWTLLRQETNLGFVKASNLGLREATTDAVLFLNNDVYLLRHEWLDEIREALEPGILVGRLRFDGHGDVDGQPLPYLDGWCLAGMRDDLLELGGFDEGYAEPAYFSDNDLSLRARAAGMTLRAAGVGLFHKTGVTAGPADDPAKLAAVSLNAPRFAARARELLSEAIA